MDFKSWYLERRELEAMTYIPPSLTEQLVTITITLALMLLLVKFLSTKTGEKFLAKIEWMF